MPDKTSKETHGPPAPPSEPETPLPAETAPRRFGPQRLGRAGRRVLIVAVALVAATLVSFVTVDLGPMVKAQAERAASSQIDRPVRIGRLSTYLLPGRFLIEDLLIEGLDPEDPPFFTSDRIVISTSWFALLRGEILIDGAEMTGWRMRVENRVDGRHNFPRFFNNDADADTDDAVLPASDSESGPDPESQAPRRIVTTLSHLLAQQGEFVYEDRRAPWSVVARNIELTIAKTRDYGGTVSFSDTTVTIGSFKPMTAEMEATYDLDGGLVDLTRIDLTMDGFESTLTGRVDLFTWPEQTYTIVESSIDLPIMKDVFFADDAFTVDGEAAFVGEWHIFDGGRELTGSFHSENARLNPLMDYVAGAGLAFPGVQGSLVWTDDRFEVFEASSLFYDGTLAFGYAMQPLGAPTPAVALFEAEYDGVSLAPLFDALEVPALRPQGRATGRNRLEWPLGRFAERRGEGELDLTPPDGAVLMRRGADAAAVRSDERDLDDAEFLWRFPLGGALSYSLGPEWLEIGPSRLATRATVAEFEGRTAYGERSRIAFDVASADWQDSDRVMAAVLTAVGNPTRAITVGGRGEMSGVMLGSFGAPRLEGRFVGDEIRAWNVGWGHGEGMIVVEDGYLDVTDGRFGSGQALLELSGRFSLGFPRADGGEEIDARFTLSSFPAKLMREAFQLDGYLIDGPLTGEIQLTGRYTQPYGVGQLAVHNAVAYGEPFDSASAGLRFEGNGVRLDGLDVRKGEGVITGAAFIEWNGTYSFNADGRDLAVESIRALDNTRAPLTGYAQFTALGVGAFEDPRYEVRGTITDITIGREAVGDVTGRVDVRDGIMGLDAEAASTRLAISASGRVDLTSTTDADLLFRFTNTSLDPYVRAFQPTLSADIAAVVSGTLRVTGQLRDIEQLRVDATVEQARIDLFDVSLRNEGPVQLVLDRNVVHAEQMQLAGDGTLLDLSGQVGLGDDRVAIQVTGDAALSILEALFPDVRSSGTALLVAEIGGTLAEPAVRGEASVTGGRIRHLSLPHGLENLEGQLVFEPEGVRFDGLTGELGGGRVQFGGRLGLRGYEVGDLNVTAVGTALQLRFPEGMRSSVDAELALVGGLDDPLLSGTVTVRDAVWLDLFEPSTGLLNFTSAETALAPAAIEPTLPLRFDVRITAPSSLRISDNTARIVSSAELTLGGTYDQLRLFGNAQIERGEVFFEGNRYRVTRGSISFANPTEVEPFFDIEAETDVRVPGQTYRVTLGVVGTMDRLDFELSSDPPLPEFEILSLLLGDVRDPQAAEIRSLRAQEASRQELFQAGAARLLTSPLSSGVGRVVEESFGVDTFAIAPSLGDPSVQQSAQLVPTARLLIGKRISDRAHVTFSRTLTGANQDIIVVLEYDQNDRLSWIVSQNEDRTYALDFRMRHAF